MVDHACNLSYLGGGRKEEYHELKVSLGKGRETLS
jgi:hypothetical protein